jgi:hypothetical protein
MEGVERYISNRISCSSSFDIDKVVQEEYIKQTHKLKNKLVALGKHVDHATLI